VSPDLHWLAQVIIAVAFLVAAITQFVRTYRKPPGDP
jgi:cytochrome b561